MSAAPVGLNWTGSWACRRPRRPLLIHGDLAAAVGELAGAATERAPAGDKLPMGSYLLTVALAVDDAQTNR